MSAKAQIGVHLPDQDLAGLGRIEAALSGRGQASSVPRIQCALRFKVQPVGFIVFTVDDDTGLVRVYGLVWIS